MIAEQVEAMEGQRDDPVAPAAAASAAQVSITPVASEAGESETFTKADFELLKNKFEKSEVQVELLMIKFEAMKQTMESKEKEPSHGKMDKLQGFNPKDMAKPTPYDMEPGSFHNWNELFMSYMISIDKQWEKILHELQKKDMVMNKEEVEKIQDELNMTQEDKKSANRSLYINLIGYTKGKARSRVISNAVDMSFETYRFIYHKGKNATTMNIVIMKADVLRPAPASKMEDIEHKLNEWKEKQRYLEEVGEAALKDDQKKPLLISILPTSTMEYMLKNPAM